MGVTANFTAKIDVGEGSIGHKLDFVVEMGSEGGNEVVGVLAEVSILWEEVDEIPN